MARAHTRKSRYDYLVVVPGLKSDFSKVEGLEEALGEPNGPVSSIYKLDTVEKTWDNIRNFKGGRAVSDGWLTGARSETDAHSTLLESDIPA